jgi:hypothetical protein
MIDRKSRQKSLLVEVEVDPDEIVESSVAGSGIDGKGKFG